MEFSLFDIFGIFQKAEFISRLLARIDIVDFITFAIVIGTIYSKMGAGTSKLEASFKDNFNKFETESVSRFSSLTKDIDIKITELKENNTKNATRIEQISTTLTTTINNVENKLSAEIRENRTDFKQDILGISTRVDRLQDLFLNVKIKK